MILENHHDPIWACLFLSPSHSPHSYMSLLLCRFSFLTLQIGFFCFSIYKAKHSHIQVSAKMTAWQILVQLQEVQTWLQMSYKSFCIFTVGMSTSTVQNKVSYSPQRNISIMSAKFHFEQIIYIPYVSIGPVQCCVFSLSLTLLQRVIRTRQPTIIWTS